MSKVRQVARCGRGAVVPRGYVRRGHLKVGLRWAVCPSFANRLEVDVGDR